MTSDNNTASATDAVIAIEQTVMTLWLQQEYQQVSELLTERDSLLRQQAPMTDQQYIEQRLAFDKHLAAMALSQKEEWQGQYRHSGKQKAAAMAYKKHL